MTWLGTLNFVVLQWFGIRLARRFNLVQDPKTMKFDSVSLMADGSFSTAWRCDARRVPAGWKLLRWIWPLTGWWSRYRWIKKTNE